MPEYSDLPVIKRDVGAAKNDTRFVTSSTFAKFPEPPLRDYEEFKLGGSE